MSFAEILETFKEAETAENIVPLTEHEELRSGVVAWKTVCITYKKPDGDLPEDASPAQQWEWLWSQVDFDVRAFGVVAGCQPQASGNLFNRLKGLQLIYPDATINTWAAKYLQAIIMSKIPKPKTPKKSTQQ